MRRGLVGVGIALVSISCFAQETKVMEVPTMKVEGISSSIGAQPKENRVTLYGASLVYEHIKQDDVYASLMLQPIPFTHAFAIGGRIGHNYGLDGSKTITPYISSLHVQEKKKGNSYLGIGLKYNQRINDSFSMGCNLESMAALNNKRMTATALETPVTFYMGAQKNYDIEVKPFVGFVTKPKKSTKPMSGVFLGFGYNF